MNPAEPQPSPPADGRGVVELTWIGNATTVLRLDGFTVLTDPNFLHAGERVYLGKGLVSKRLREPAMQPGDLPPLDAVLLSHLHGDHFDRVAKEQLSRSLPILTTAHAARRLERWGFEAATPLDTWSAHELERGEHRLRVTSLPGQHGPVSFHRLLPPVMGSLLELERPGRPTFRLYITGDTLFRPWLREIATRWPQIDAVLIHLGGTRALGVLVTMDGQQGADLIELFQPPLTIPIHYDDYSVMRSPLSEFTDEVALRQLGGEVRLVARGDTIPLSS